MHYKIVKDQYKVSKWSGGETREIFIYPKGSFLENRDFVFRISSASVENNQSIFSFFSGYDRIITTLDGEIEIHHELDSEKIIKKLKPKDMDHFSGDIKTISFGKCNDFNVIYKNGIEATLFVVNDPKIKLIKEIKYIFFALENIDFSVSYKNNVETVSLKKGDSYYIESIKGEVIFNDIEKALCATINM